MLKIAEVQYDWSAGFINRVSTEYLVIHHAAHPNCTAQDVHRWHLGNGWTGIGYHYFINKLGDIYRGRPEKVVGAHAVGFNLNSIGVCLEGNFDIEWPTNEQYVSLGKLIQLVKSRYKDVKVVRHKSLLPTACPGKNFDLSKSLVPSNISVFKKIKVTFQGFGDKSIPLDAYLIGDGKANKTYVEARKIFEQMGLKVIWKSDEGTIIKM